MVSQFEYLKMQVWKQKSGAGFIYSNVSTLVPSSMFVFKTNINGVTRKECHSGNHESWQLVFSSRMGRCEIEKQEKGFGLDQLNMNYYSIDSIFKTFTNLFMVIFYFSLFEWWKDKNWVIFIQLLN